MLGSGILREIDDSFDSFQLPLNMLEKYPDYITIIVTIATQWETRTVTLPVEDRAYVVSILLLFG